MPTRRTRIGQGCREWPQAHRRVRGRAIPDRNDDVEVVEFDLLVRSSNVQILHIAFFDQFTILEDVAQMLRKLCTTLFLDCFVALILAMTEQESQWIQPIPSLQAKQSSVGVMQRFLK